MTLSYFFKAIRRKVVYSIAPICSCISPMLNTKLLYRYNFGKRLDLNNPVTLNDKILWLKFNTYWNNPVIKQCADKYAVRKYLEKRGYSEILVKLIASYEKPDEIEWNKLPDSFAMKLNIGCGKNIIVSNKTQLNIDDTNKLLKQWMKEEYWRGHSEMQYKDVKKRIIIEEYLGNADGDLPEDYKFYCMNGKSKYVMVCENRIIGEKAKYYYFDRNWNMMPYTQDAIDEPKRIIEKPKHIDEAFNYAEQLSKGFPFVRVDLYIVNGKVYFGELTFTPSAGFDSGRLRATDVILGEQLVLPM